MCSSDLKVIDSASATASSLASLLEVHGLAADPDPDGVRHLQLTTGDVAAFTRAASLLFGSLFPAVEGVRVGPGRSGGSR